MKEGRKETMKLKTGKMIEDKRKNEEGNRSQKDK